MALNVMKKELDSLTTVQGVEEEHPPVSILMAADWGSGKTHFCLEHADATCDAEAKAEAISHKFDTPNYTVVEKWHEVVAFALKCAKDPAIRVVAFDTVRSLEKMAEEEACEKLGWDTLYTNAGGASKYSEVNSRLESLVYMLRYKARKTVIFTCHLKDEYANNERTGRQLPEAPKALPRDVNYIIQRTTGVAWPGDKPTTLSPKALWFKVVKDGALPEWDRPPYVVLLPGMGMDELLDQLETATDDQYYERLRLLGTEVVVE